jgi:hypothetical protein
MAMINKTWSSFRRANNSINKAEFNDTVNQLFNTHYKYLYTSLVKSEYDCDVFNDTYIKLTYSYYEDKDFVDEFMRIFKLLKSAYRRDDLTEGNKLVVHTVFAETIGDSLIEEEEVTSTPGVKYIKDLSNFNFFKGKI